MDAKAVSRARAEVSARGLALLRLPNVDAEALEKLAEDLHEPESGQRLRRKGNAAKTTPARVGPRREGAVKGHARVRRLGNVPGALFCRTGAEWHADGLGRWTALACIKAPSNGGGDTLFAWSHEMLERLRPETRAIADDLVCRFGDRFVSGSTSTSAEDARHGFRMNALGTRILRNAETRSSPRDPTRGFSIPLVRNEGTSLTVDMRHFEHFEGMDVNESRDLLEAILLEGLGVSAPPDPLQGLDPVSLFARGDHAIFDDRCVYRHRWQPGDVLVWDNDVILHSPTATAPYEGFPGSREMLQIIFRAP
ncbi:Hypothetical Protein FCC1311_050512 [Hondaea fermentalgiana]|uniref:TauD/TfdA-like domain-containing protein n=1 Tax=Hondaea fermentalgiana TaxID=2315210 RepID=A0A2R5GCY2_9STRA|nr:Hypothetical Protein FCC1311_050512 [Hondaea fermentalgiana]|eukprot:GBG28830.1 Hypothetical Protein FCC1311_050512 [Hondaea fermentalgiana]